MKYLLIFLALIIILLFVFIKTKDQFDTKNTNDIENKIPKTIIQTWKTNKIPNKYKILVESIKKNNNEFKYILITDQDMENLVKNKYPEYYNKFSNLKKKIMKIEFIRCLAIYHYGGFYFDLDMSINKNLSPLFKYNAIVPIELYNNTDKILQKQNMNYLLGNYALAGSRGNKFFKLVCENILNERIDNKYIPKNEHSEIYYLSGPVMLSQSYLDYNKKKSVKLLEHPNKKHASFGDYGTHHMFGSWK
jgi:mannosyltransferase OCH1-like enzyme